MDSALSAVDATYTLLLVVAAVLAALQSHRDLTVAKALVIGGAALMTIRWNVWALTTDSSWQIRAVVGAVIGALLFALVPAAIHWLSSRQDEVSRTAEAPKPPTGAPATGTSTAQSGGQTAGNIINTGPVFNAPVTLSQPEKQILGSATPAFREGSSPFPNVTYGCITLGLFSTLTSGEGFPLLSIRAPDGRIGHLITLYVKDNILYANVDLPSPKTGAGFTLKDGTYTIYAPNWDVNSNDNAMEVVNEDGTVIFQLIRNTKMNLTMRGFIQVAGLIHFFGPRGELGSIPVEDKDHPPKPDPAFLPRIFMYPSWKYKGRLLEPPLPQPECPEKWRGRFAGISSGIIIDAKQ